MNESASAAARGTEKFNMEAKLEWQGEISGVQPRIRLMRSFDQRSHSYLGYVLTMQGQIGQESREFIVAIGKVAHTKYQFRSGDKVVGKGEPVADERLETADLYKVSELKVISRNNEPFPVLPPFLGIPPDLMVYRERGHRRLDPRTFETKCKTCFWGCEMPVEMIVDQWNPTAKKYRRETFCYGPKSCPVYRPGPVRTVSGRKGMSWREEDWVDEEATAHRGPDD